MNTCENCNVCCTGIYPFDIEGRTVSPKDPCKYTRNNSCSVYHTRPQKCHDFSCIYLQNIVDGFKSPAENGIFAYEKYDDLQTKYIKAIVSDFYYDRNQLSLLRNWCIENKTFVVVEMLSSNYDKHEQNVINYVNTLHHSRSDELFGNFINELVVNISQRIKNFKEDDHNLLKNSIQICHVLFNSQRYNECIEILDFIISSVQQEPHNENKLNFQLNKFKCLIELNRSDECIEQMLDLEKTLEHSREYKKYYHKLVKQISEHYYYSGDQENSIKTELKRVKLEQITEKDSNPLVYFSGDLQNSFRLYDQNSKQSFVSYGIDKLEYFDSNVKPLDKVFFYDSVGIGDHIIALRFMKYLIEKDIEVIFLSTEQLKKHRKDFYDLLEYNGVEVKYLPGNEEVFKTHKYATHYSIIGALKLDVHQLWQSPYLKYPNSYYQKWNKKLKNIKKIKVGVRWQGNPGYKNDIFRKLDLKDIMSSFSGIEDHFDFYNLQKDSGLEQLNDYKNIHDYSDELETWFDTLGLISNLDVVITSCTSIAHAAAALGKRTIVFSPIDRFVVWYFRDENGSPYFYDKHVTILDQKKRRNWEDCTLELRELIENEFL